MASAALDDMCDDAFLAYLAREGLAMAFDPCDGRRGIFTGLWPGDDMKAAEARAVVKELRDKLPCDTYGGVDAVRLARDTYNSRTLAVC